VAFVIALSGKGGTGKTTLAALMVRHLSERTGRAVLAVDADPNSCLGPALGVEPERTVADIREDVREDRLNLAPGMSKERQVEYLIQSVVLEDRRFDLLTMGRPEGPKCYCYVNTLLRKYLDEVTGDYPFVILDNEAGMEHLSRRTTNNVDRLYVVSDTTALGARTVDRIMQIAADLPVSIAEKAVIANRVLPGEDADRFIRAVESSGYSVALQVPEDPDLYQVMAQGQSVFHLPASSAALRSVAGFLDQIVAVRL